MLGVLVNAMARTPFVFIQGVGYARWTAVLHLLELPVYATALWLLLHGELGIEGAALAWSGRMVVDTVALYGLSARLEPRLLSTVARDLLLMVAACLAAVALSGVFS
jgi:Na+-driven multidrug efflux pump